MSPYLFILCAEGLSALINKVARNQALHGISVCCGSLRVTHLLFADDSLLFCQANGQECRKLIEILVLYGEVSGQVINTDKSSVFFSQNTPQATKDEVLHFIGPMQDTRHTKYLGLPSLIGKSKTQIFAAIKERVGKKLTGWKEKILSMGGKEVLIKAVAQAIPTYSISCFQLPKGFCEELESMTIRFWWGQKQHESKIAWIGWIKLCQPKLKGGMGFRNL